MSELLPILYLGDSHVRYFRKAALLDLIYPYVLDGVEVGGATAVGMRNPNSKTDAIGQYRKWIADKDRSSIVLLHLGEVDCGSVIWYRAEKHGESPESQVRESIETYVQFVDELIDMGFTRVVLTGATLPTITDNDQEGEVVEARSWVKATMRERTDLTLEYNRQLAAAAAARGLAFVDIAEDVIDPDTGVVNMRLRNKNPQDHHMDLSLAAVHWAHRLAPVLDAIPVTPEVYWKATRDTFLKGFPGHSKNIPEHLLVRVPAGEVVVADEIAMRDGYVLIRNARFRGRQFPLARVLEARHFTRLA